MGVSDRLCVTLFAELLVLDGDDLVSLESEQPACGEEVPPRVEYSLTSHGRALEPALTALSQWGKRHEKWLKQREKAAE